MLAKVIPLRSAPAVDAEERTQVVRTAGGRLTWAAIARDIASQRKPAPVPVVSLTPAPVPPPERKASKAPSRPQKATPAPWAKLQDRWGIDALIDREHESAARVRSMPARVGQLLKLPEWAGSTVDMERDIPSGPIGYDRDTLGRHPPIYGCHPESAVREWIVLRHPSGAVMRLDPTKIAM